MNLLNEKDCLMIGECGMDRLRGPDLAFQQMVFARQVDVAHKLNMPLIIHCVRAFNEVATVLKSTGIITPVIFHGYNNNLQIMRQILAGNIFFSLGRALLQEGSNAQKVALELPLEHLFLETDDADISIEILYAKLADLKKISFNDVEAAIFANYLRLKR